MPTEFELPGSITSDEILCFPSVIRSRLVKHLEAIVPPRSGHEVSPLTEQTCLWGEEGPRRDTFSVIEEWTVQVRAAVLEVSACVAC